MAARHSYFCDDLSISAVVRPPKNRVKCPFSPLLAFIELFKPRAKIHRLTFYEITLPSIKSYTKKCSETLLLIYKHPNLQVNTHNYKAVQHRRCLICKI